MAKVPVLLVLTAWWQGEPESKVIQVAGALEVRVGV